MEYLSYLIYALPLLLIAVALRRRRVRLERTSDAVHATARAAGLVEPVSLHPVVDPARCIGCGSCVKACPEQPEHHVLGLLRGRAHLVSPTECIGHGACKT
ncbi:MAG TPA: 4Fe-4S dicluster domain-containing protein, partial [Longimicrobiales bacterium]|nr:4Fe-4S dicluster domain-containing protein [Longimicrobiales bacterium]